MVHRVSVDCNVKCKYTCLKLDLHVMVLREVLLPFLFSCVSILDVNINHRTIRGDFKTQVAVDWQFRLVPGGCHCLEQ